MFKKGHILILLIAIIISGYAFVSIYQMANPYETNNPSAITSEIIANDSAEGLGTVEVIKNIGNPNSKKIAYVVGVHPLENDTHKTLLNLLPTLTNLNYCYDIYVINVTEDFSGYGELLPDDDPGRDTGQNLAYKYVYPEIANGSYELAIDIHAHGGAYPYDTFVFSPVDGGSGESYARNVSQNTENISYYNPYQTTSGPYLTIPLNEHGIPAFYFEENSFISQEIKDKHMLELIDAIDNLKL
ncbi:MAG: hypothetical protein IKF11_10255 [Methanobrevibacter sp.]|nr:hypothetical protein [Methanobrevibacter sp.]